jgi:hypothetical protein
MITLPVVIKNFINAEDAQILINEINNPSEVNPYPEYYKTRYGGTAYPYNKIVLNIQKKYSLLSNETHQRLNPEETKQIKTFKSFGSVWTKGSSANAHADDQSPEEFIEYSTVIYLDDNFTGGELYFPGLNFTYKPEKYDGIFFISDGELWSHGISEIESGHRTTLLYMHTTHTEHPEGYTIVDPDLN